MSIEISITKLFRMHSRRGLQIQMMCPEDTVPESPWKRESEEGKRELRQQARTRWASVDV